MENETQHVMEIKNTYENGAEEWYCPVCGRHFIIQWPPNYKRVILEEGDLNVIHTGGTSGLSMGSAQVDYPVEAEEHARAEHLGAEEPGGVEDLDDPYLAPFTEFLTGKL